MHTSRPCRSAKAPAQRLSSPSCLASVATHHGKETGCWAFHLFGAGFCACTCTQTQHVSYLVCILPLCPCLCIRLRVCTPNRTPVHPYHSTPSSCSTPSIRASRTPPHVLYPQPHGQPRILCTCCACCVILKISVQDVLCLKQHCLPGASSMCLDKRPYFSSSCVPHLQPLFPGLHRSMGARAHTRSRQKGQARTHAERPREQSIRCQGPKHAYTHMQGNRPRQAQGGAGK